MSIQFGSVNLDRRPIDPQYMGRIRGYLEPYCRDGEQSYTCGDVAVLYCAFHTTEESRREKQPLVTRAGTVLTWDGRLDNREELVEELGKRIEQDSTDVEIVAAAYEHWGEGFLERLVGDWALSLWCPSSRSVVLAKDPIGTRHLYYCVRGDQLTWSTLLEPLIPLSGQRVKLCEEYVAGWFAFFPAAHLTPYEGLHSVPPSSMVCLRSGRETVQRYWDFSSRKQVCYRKDSEYEEHFRQAFAEAVRRRLRSDRPVLAELSGGMDSSSIVCVADGILSTGDCVTPRLDTISYYDDSEPNWNERPYFEKVEQKRGRPGWHIAVDSDLEIKTDQETMSLLPGACGPVGKVQREFAECLRMQGNRVVLSGIGGDEVTGGVPTPAPELEDLLVRMRLKALARQLKLWALNKRKPWFHLLFDALRSFLPPAGLEGSRHKQSVQWLCPQFVERNRDASLGYESRLRFFGPRPSFQENMKAIHGLRRQLACSPLTPEPLYEKRFPYLDRDLLEFLFSVPRDQILRPGYRRSLMRRSLVGVVPDEILNRRRKAFVARSPIATFSVHWPELIELSQNMVVESLGIVDSDRFREALRMARQGKEVPLVSLMRTIGIELWLESLERRGLLGTRTAAGGAMRPLEHHPS